MRKIHLQIAAEQDLLDIWQYSRKQWNAAQADSYLDDLDRGMQLLARNPESGLKRDHIRPGYRAQFIKSHVVYYTVTPTTIHIIRVLHDRMDPNRHLT